MSQEKLNEILQLPYQEKVEIYEALLIDIHREQSNQKEIPEWEKKELDRRMKLIDEGKETFYTWDEVKKHLHTK